MALEPAFGQDATRLWSVQRTAGDPWADLKDFTLTIANGVATARGYTFNQAAKLEVLRRISQAPGVEMVRDGITLRGNGPGPSHLESAAIANELGAIGDHGASISLLPTSPMLRKLAAFTGVKVASGSALRMKHDRAQLSSYKEP